MMRPDVRQSKQTTTKDHFPITAHPEALYPSLPQKIDNDYSFHFLIINIETKWYYLYRREVSQSRLLYFQPQILAPPRGSLHFPKPTVRYNLCNGFRPSSGLCLIQL